MYLGKHIPPNLPLPFHKSINKYVPLVELKLSTSRFYNTIESETKDNSK